MIYSLKSPDGKACLVLKLQIQLQLKQSLEGILLGNAVD